MKRTRLSPDERRSQLIELGVSMLSGRPLSQISVDEIAGAPRRSRGDAVVDTLKKGGELAKKAWDAGAAKQLKAAGGRGSLRTVEGELLVVALDPTGRIVVSDRDGPAFAITEFDRPAFNGLVHTVAGVAVPPPLPKKRK